MTASSIRPTPGGCSALALAAVLNAPIAETRFGIFRM